MQFSRARRSVAQETGVWDLPKWHQYDSTALMLLECTPRCYATDPWMQRHSWSRRLGEANWLKMSMCNCEWTVRGTVSKRSTCVRIPVRSSRRSMIPALGPVSQPRLRPIHHFSHMFCQREGQLRAPRKPVEGWCRQTCSMLFRRRTSFEHREPR